jgi:hypothetical protein
LDLYKQPLSEQSIEAIMKLSEVAEERKMKKEGKKMKKGRDEEIPQEGKQGGKQERGQEGPGGW